MLGQSTKIMRLGLQLKKLEIYLVSMDKQTLFLPTDNNPPVYLVIAKNDCYTAIKPSRVVSRVYLIGLLTDVLGMLTRDSGRYVDPKDCTAFHFAITIDEKSGIFVEGDDEEGEDDTDDGECVPVE